MRTAVFLRGINVGGHAKISMAQLREVLSRHGHPDVKTLLQSGNVVVDRVTEAAMEKLLRDEFGMPIRVMTRTHAQLRKVIEANPFPQHEQEPAKLAVAFLDKAPGRVSIDSQRYCARRVHHRWQGDLPVVPQWHGPQQGRRQDVREVPGR